MCILCLHCIFIGGLSEYETIHRLRYFRFWNVLHIWTIRAIPTYRVYRLYDKTYHFFIGTATRYCNTEGQWEETNVLRCTSVKFIRLELLVSIIITMKAKMYNGRNKQVCHLILYFERETFCELCSFVHISECFLHECLKVIISYIE